MTDMFDLLEESILNTLKKYLSEDFAEDVLTDIVEDIGNDQELWDFLCQK